MTTWLRDGTVSVTNGSANITFTGADLIAGNVRIGDEFKGPDGNDYEIASVVSATSATIAPAYLGATAAGQSYAIQPTRGIVQLLYNQVTALIATVTGHVDGVLSGLFPDGTVDLPSISFSSDSNTGIRRVASDRIALVGGGVDKLTWTGSAASGDIVQANATDTTSGRLLKVGAFGLGQDAGQSIANVDNLAESGLFYGLGGAHPGVTPGDNPFPSVSGAFGMISGNSSLGDPQDYRWQMAVRLSASEPEAVFRSSVTNAGGWSDWVKIFTSGDAEFANNGNGSYARLPDGTQICWHNFFTANNAAVTWTFPAAFVDTDVTCIPVSGFETAPRIMGQSVPTATSVDIRSFDETGSENVAPRVQVIAIGRWK